MESQFVFHGNWVFLLSHNNLVSIVMVELCFESVVRTWISMAMIELGL